MIDHLNISYNRNGLSFIISVDDTRSENLPYNLAEVFAELIRQSDANEEIVIEQLINEFGYKQKGSEK